MSEYDDFVDSVLFELVTWMPNLKTINFGWLNLSDNFCILFSNFFANKVQVPNLIINDNYKITNVGKKSLEVLYTKHFYA